MSATKPRTVGGWVGHSDTGPRSPAARAEEYDHFRGFGWSDQCIAQRLGITLDALHQALRRAKERTDDAA